jgi:hypothetical protein
MLPRLKLDSSAYGHAGDKWPPRTGEQENWQGPDILCIGFQEITQLSALNVMSGGTNDNAKAWDAAIGCALNQQPLPASYVVAQVCISPLNCVILQG